MLLLENDTVENVVAELLSLEESLNTTNVNILFMGIFNTKHTEWADKLLYLKPLRGKI